MKPSCIPLRVLISAGMVALATACTDTSTDTSQPLAPSMDVVNGPSGEYILAVSTHAYAAVVADIADLGGSVVRGHRGAGIILAGDLSDEAAATLSATSGVRAIVRDDVIQGALPPAGSAMEYTSGSTLSGTPEEAGLWAFQWNMRVIHADDAWHEGYTGSAAVSVAIIDSGIDPYHQDLAGLVDWDHSVAFVSSVNPLGPAWGDDYFHGTHVAGTVASNGLGTWAVAPNTTLIAVKVCGSTGSCPIQAVVFGILYAADVGATVGNLSLGGFSATNEEDGGQLRAIFNQVVQYAARQGMLLVSAGGNDGVDLNHLGRDYRLGSWVNIPCEAGSGVCVSATGPTDEIAYYSNYGVRAIDVAAPGGDDLVPDPPFPFNMVLAPCSSLSAIPACAGETTVYVWAAGTSMAAPHVTGAAALLAAQGVTGWSVLKTSLQITADDLGRKGTDPYYGKGRINVLSLVEH